MQLLGQRKCCNISKQGPGPQDTSATHLPLWSWEVPGGKKQAQGRLGAGLKQEATLGTIRWKKLSSFPGHTLVLALKAHMPGMPSEIGTLSSPS